MIRRPSPASGAPRATRNSSSLNFQARHSLGEYDDKEGIEQIEERIQRIHAYLKALHSGVLFIAWCCIAAGIILFLILIKMLRYY
jgi:hypothetical protein